MLSLNHAVLPLFRSLWLDWLDIFLQPLLHGGAALVRHGEGPLLFHFAELIAQLAVPQLGVDGAGSQIDLYISLPLSTRL